MNGLEKHGLDEGNFGAKGNIVSAFDAFPKSKPEYVTRTAGGGKWTVAMIIMSIILTFSEIGRWWRGTETHNFAVEKGVSRSMQTNLDIVVHMLCSDLHINVQDAAGDRILAATQLRRDPTLWSQWVDAKGIHKLGKDSEGRVVTGEGWQQLGHDEGFGEEHVHDIVALGKKRAKWSKTPRLRGRPDSCRIYGSLDLNKVQGDFHITARGHGYREMSKHLDHSQFNFSHIISELSYGAFYPSLVNPLDRTVNYATANFHKFQYYVSVVPTMYSVGSSNILTNQYAVTEQSKEVNERVNIPGIFVKYDIEPILLAVYEDRDNLLLFFIKLINVVSGVLVAGHWGFTLSEWAREVLGRKRRSSGGEAAERPRGVNSSKSSFMATATATETGLGLGSSSRLSQTTSETTRIRRTYAPLTTQFSQRDECRYLFDEDRETVFPDGVTVTYSTTNRYDTAFSSCQPSGWEVDYFQFSPAICPSGWTYNDMGTTEYAVSTAYCCASGYYFFSDLTECGSMATFGLGEEAETRTTTDTRGIPYTETAKTVYLHRAWQIKWEASDTAKLPVSLPELTSNRVIDMWQPSATTTTTTTRSNNGNKNWGDGGQYASASARFPISGILVLAIFPTLILAGLLACYIAHRRAKKKENQQASEAMVLGRIMRRRSERKADGETGQTVTTTTEQEQEQEQEGQTQQMPQTGILRRQMGRYL